MPNKSNSEKIIALFAKNGVTLSYARLTDDNRIGVRCEPDQVELAIAAIKGIGYSEIETVPSFDEMTIIGKKVK